jgi:hypothetical protein
VAVIPFEWELPSVRERRDVGYRSDSGPEPVLLRGRRMCLIMDDDGYRDEDDDNDHD